jgi:hypothetical protein
MFKFAGFRDREEAVPGLQIFIPLDLNLTVCVAGSARHSGVRFIMRRDGFTFGPERLVTSGLATACLAAVSIMTG